MGSKLLPKHLWPPLQSYWNYRSNYKYLFEMHRQAKLSSSDRTATRHLRQRHEKPMGQICSKHILGTVYHIIYGFLNSIWSTQRSQTAISRWSLGWSLPKICYHEKRSISRSQRSSLHSSSEGPSNRSSPYICIASSDTWYNFVKLHPPVPRAGIIWSNIYWYLLQKYVLRLISW